MEGPWYKDGLAFECQMCGACCTGEPGYVWLSPEDIERITSHLDIPKHGFLKSYCRRIGRGTSLTEVKDGDCVFLENKKTCRIHAVRPEQCRTYPFWPEFLKSPSHWQAQSQRCPGFNKGEPIPLDEIQTRMWRSGHA